MKLKKLTLENFRSFKGKHEIEFSPITLLFGGNSVGKSSITKAIYNFDFLSKQDIYNGENLVSVGLHFDEVEISDNFLLYASHEMRLINNLFKEQEPFAFFEGFAKSCHSLSIERKYEAGPELEQWVYGIDDLWFLHIQDELEPEINGGKWEKTFVKFNLGHPVLRNSSFKESINNLNRRFSEIQGQAQGYATYLIRNCWDAFLVDDGILSLSEHLIKYTSEKLDLLELDIGRLVLVIKAITNEVKKQTSTNKHLGPLRKIPNLISTKKDIHPLDIVSDKYYQEYKKRKDDKAVYSGESAWKRLAKKTLIFDDEMQEKSDLLLEDVNDWLLNWFNTPYEINLFENYSFEIDSEEKRQRFERGEISKEDMSSSGTKVRFKNVQNGSVTPASEIGVGISQLTPVIVNAINTKNFSVEQPELHIHPRMQTIVADLFVFEGLYEQAEKDQASVTIQTKNLDGIQKERSFVRKEEYKESFILVETHSEHLMLRLLKRVREEILKPEDLAIYYFENDNGKTKATKIGVDEEGEFTEAWPQGFFEERLEELF